MQDIVNLKDKFNFENLSLQQPKIMQGGSYFARILNNDKPLYVQTLTCRTKQGIQKSGKKYYCDFMYDADVVTFTSWLEQLETHCQKMIYEHSSEWFENDLDLSDIESSFASCIRIYKSGKFHLVRASIKNSQETQCPNLKIYDESENVVDFTLVSNETQLISILEFQGIKCTPKSFQLEIEVKQILVLDDAPTFVDCMITPPPTTVRQMVTTTQKSENVPTSANKVSPSQENMHQLRNNTSSKNDSFEKTMVPKDEIILEEGISKDEIILEEGTITRKSENERTSENKNFAPQENLHEVGNESNNYILDDIENRKEDYFENTMISKDKEKLEENPRSQNYHSSLGKYGEIDERKNTNIVRYDEPELIELTDVEFGNPHSNSSFVLKDPNIVYKEMYKRALDKAMRAKTKAIQSFLEAKNIKEKYILQDVCLDSYKDDIDSEIDDLTKVRTFV